MRVYTNIKTLKQVKMIANDCGVGGLLDAENRKSELTISELVKKLLDDDKLVEFMRAITRDNETDFEEMEAEEIGGLINDFFTGIGKFLPASLRELLKSQSGLPTIRPTSS